MNFRNRFLFTFLLPVVLQVSFVQFGNSQDMLMGIVSNKLVSISPVNGTLTELADLSPALQPQIRGITYHPDRCLFYSFIDDLNTPKLVSIALDGTTNLIGNITLPSNMVTIVESISYNEADGQVYLSARINLPAGPGTYFSATILQVNVDNAVCTLVGAVNTGTITEDIDATTHYNGDFITLDASSAPGSTWARFYRFPPALIGSGSNIPQIYAVSNFQTATDLAVFQDEVYFTSNRMLYKGDPDNFLPVLVGQMYTAAEYGGALLQAIATVTPSSLAGINLGPDLELCTGETAALEILPVPGASIIWNNGVTGLVNPVSSSGTYWVQASLGTCGSVSDTVVVNFNNEPVPVNLGPDLELCAGETATLQIPEEAGASILWSNGITESVNTVGTSGTYWVQVTLGTCAPVSDTVAVNFIECPDLSCTYKYFIPNVFSPNDDGINDKFEVYINPVSCILESIQVQIFDRWGELVYQGTSLSAWDGVFRGRKALSGVYVYVINMAFNKGAMTETVFEKGDVTLIR